MSSARDMDATDELRIAVDLARRPLPPDATVFLEWVYNHRATLAWGLRAGQMLKSTEDELEERGLLFRTGRFLFPTPTTGKLVRYLYET